MDPARMLHISLQDLLSALGADGDGRTRDRLGGSAGAVGGPKGVDEEAVARQLDHRARASGLAAVPTVTGEVAAGLVAPDVAEVAAGLTDVPDFVDPTRGRSTLYGFHYLLWTRPILQAAVVRPADRERWAGAWARIFDAWYASRDEVRGDWPGLDVVWYTLGVTLRSRVCAEALDVFGDALPAGTRCRLYATILASGRWLAEEHRTFRYGNWQFVGVCGLAVLARVFDGFAEAPTWRSVAEARIRDHLRLDVHPDGGHSERSPSYHAFCVDSLDKVAALDALPAADGTCDPRERLLAMHRWILEMATPEGWVPPFQDSALIHAGRCTATGFAVTGDPLLGSAAVRLLGSADAVQQVAAAWGRPTAAPLPEPREDRPGVTYLPESGYVVGRAGTGPGRRYWALNAGAHVDHELESHSHRSSLDVVLWGGGGPLVWEAGGPWGYDTPDYQSWYQDTRGHSTVVLPRTIGRDREATVDVVHSGRSVDAVAGHHHGWGVHHRRVAVHLHAEPGYWIIHDEVADDGPWSALLHATGPWRPLPDAPGFVSANGATVLALSTPEPAGSGPTTVPGRSATGAPTPVPAEVFTLAVPGSPAGTLAVVCPPGTSPSAARSDGERLTLAPAPGAADTVVRGAWWRERDGVTERALWWRTDGGRTDDGSPVTADGRVVLAEVEHTPSGARAEVVAHGAGRLFVRVARTATADGGGPGAPPRALEARLRRHDEHDEHDEQHEHDATVVPTLTDTTGRLVVHVPTRGRWVVDLTAEDPITTGGRP